jgi:hypothetical protein
MKRCPRCKAEKPLDQFTPDASKASGYMSHCKPCVADRSREYYARTKGAAARARYQADRRERIAQSIAWRRANPDQVRQSRQRRRAANPEKFRQEERVTYMKRHDGIDEWARMWKAQQGRCYLCQRPLPEDGSRVAVDHDHSCCPSGQHTQSCRYCRRGLTHQACNQIWGLAREDPELLRVMADQGERVSAETRQRIVRKAQQQELLTLD